MAAHPVYSALENLTARLKPIILDEPDGAVRVLEPTALFSCRIPNAQLLSDKNIAASIEEIFANRDNHSRQPVIRVGINVVQEALALDGIAEALVALSEFLRPHAAAQIKIHFDRPPVGWTEIIDRVTQIRSKLDEPKNVDILFYGPFAIISDPEMEALFDLGVRIRYSAGWIGTTDLGNGGRLDSGSLRKISEFGFRTPIVWYVHAGNISAFDQQISRLLLANFCSGFSLPLASENPYYRFSSGFPELPSAEDYCQFLVSSYKRYPHYDDVMNPLTDLALLVRSGGWHHGMNVSSTLPIFVDAHGCVGLYRQSPALAIPWIQISEATTLPPDVLRRQFSAFIADKWEWNKNEYCRDCRWRTVCGALDHYSYSTENDAIKRSHYDAMCEYRLLFLEHFALMQRATFNLEA